jgi:hypothetical protein
LVALGAEVGRQNGAKLGGLCTGAYDGS